MLLTAVSLFGSGCALFVVGAAAGAGAGTVMWVKGELKTAEAVPYERACRAAEAGLTDLGYAITGREQTGITCCLIARGAGDKKIQVTVEKSSATVSEIRVRVGLFGDEPLSRQILESIKKRL